MAGFCTCRDAIMEDSWILSTPGFCICKCCTRFWICLNMAEQCLMAEFCICLVKASQGFKWASGSKYARAQNTLICEGHAGCWICETWALRKTLRRKHKKKKPHREKFWKFLSKTTFGMENLTQRYMQSGPSFPKPGHFFRFSRREEDACPLSLVAFLWVWLTEYALTLSWLRLFHIETSSLICRANQWTGFYITASVMKELLSLNMH